MNIKIKPIKTIPLPASNAIVPNNRTHHGTSMIFLNEAHYEELISNINGHFSDEQKQKINAARKFLNQTPIKADVYL